MKFLIVGAGVIGCHTAARMFDVGHDVTILARGEKAQRLSEKGITIKNGITGEVRNFPVPVAKLPVKEHYDIVLVCTQANQRPSVLPTLASLKGIEVYCFIGNTLSDYTEEAEVLGEDRILSGFASVGGTWQGDTLVIADRKGKGDRPYDRFIMGAPFESSRKHLDVLRSVWKNRGLKMTTNKRILSWHLTHTLFILPLAAVVYDTGGDLNSLKDKQIEEAVENLKSLVLLMKERKIPLVPRKFSFIPYMSTSRLVRRVKKSLQTPFGAIALAGHAKAAQKEMIYLTQQLSEIIKREGEDLPFLDKMLAAVSR